MSLIVTFYSYKGGVGRSMALANIAVLLARRGLRVLAVDWDLEAPGLERYFSYFEQSSRKGGLLPFFVDAAERLGKKLPIEEYRDHLWSVDVEGELPLHVLPSGRDSHTAYATMLHEFNWRDFFRIGGGDVVEQLRKSWKSNYDVVLIDSRTGMSDSGGICTIQMPDVLVAMFTANDQSMLGVRDIICASQRGRQTLAYDRMPLTVLPIACRFSVSSEFEQSLFWLDKFTKQFAGVCDDWLPQWMELRTVFEQLKVPQVDWFGFGERLAVKEQGITDPSSMGYVFDRITDLLASEFSDLEAAFGPAARKPPNWKRPAPEVAPPSLPESDDYEYDLYVSYRRGGALGEWTEWLVRDLGRWLELELAYPPRIFLSQSDLTVGTELHLMQSLVKSKLLLAVLTPAYSASEFCMCEWRFFQERERTDGIVRIMSVLVRGANELPDELRQRVWIDFSNEINLGSRLQGVSPQYSKSVSHLASSIAHMLATIPTAKS